MARGVVVRGRSWAEGFCVITRSALMKGECGSDSGLLGWPFMLCLNYNH